jgi:hypothetical protein
VCEREEMKFTRGQTTRSKLENSRGDKRHGRNRKADVRRSFSLHSPFVLVELTKGNEEWRREG